MPEDSRIVFKAFLDNLGLGHMSDLIDRGISDSMDPSVFALVVENDARFLAAFPEIAARNKQNQAGAGLHAFKAQDVINYRATVKRVMTNAGIPAGFYDQPEDFVDLMATKDLSPQELTSRIEQGFQRVSGAPQEVKDVFNSFFGAQGDAALATLFLDPTRGTSVLGEMVTQAEIGGTGRRFGFDIDQARAERLRELGVTDAQRATQGFQSASELRPLEQETISETTDITEEELLQGAFGVGDTTKLKKRAEERSAAFKGSGGAAQGQGGFGLGEAR